MRRITEKEKSNRNKQIGLGIILVFLMFVSVLGYAFQGEKNENNNKLIFNGYEFINQNGFWYTQIGDYQFIFRHSPNEVDRIDSKVKLLNSYSNKPLYIFSESEPAKIEIYQNLYYSNRIVSRIQNACLNETECNGDYPIKTCEDNFIIIQIKNETSITQNKSCIYLTGPSENLTEVTDEFLLKVIGVAQ